MKQSSNILFHILRAEKTIDWDDTDTIDFNEVLTLIVE